LYTNSSGSYIEAKIKLPLAMQKSDLSSADDILDRVSRRKKNALIEVKAYLLIDQKK